MCIYNSTSITMQILDSQNYLGSFLQNLFNLSKDVKEDFEVKRFMLGLTSIIKMAEAIPRSIQSSLPMIMKVLVFLSQKSLAITEKKGTNEKAEEA